MDISQVKKVVVAGGGVLGSQIAFQTAYRGYETTIWLRSEASIERARPKIEHLREVYLNTLEAMKSDPKAYAYGLIAQDEITPEKLDQLKEQVERAYSNLKLTSDWDEAFGDADFVIESVAENPEQKIEFYTELAKHLPEKLLVVPRSTWHTTLLTRFGATQSARLWDTQVPLRKTLTWLSLLRQASV